MASYTINTDHKTIEYAGCEKAEAVLFAQLHEFEGYVLEKALSPVNIKDFVILPNPDHKANIIKTENATYTLTFNVNAEL